MSLQYEVLEDVEIDNKTWTLWHYCSPKRVRNVLGMEPNEHSLVRMLGLQDTFSIHYWKPVPHCVIEFAKNFDPEVNTFKFCGKVYPLTKDVLREAFQLPTGKFAKLKKAWNGKEIAKLFQTQDRPYSIAKLEEAVKEWEGPIRLVSELLLGRRKPTQVNGKQMWYFYSHLWPTILDWGEEYEKPLVRPDWAELMQEDLKQELDVLCKHLQRNPPGSLCRQTKKFSCYCATAVTHILRHLGFSLEQMNGEGAAKRDNDIQIAINISNKSENGAGAAEGGDVDINTSITPRSRELGDNSEHINGEGALNILVNLTQRVSESDRALELTRQCTDSENLVLLELSRQVAKLNQQFADSRKPVLELTREVAKLKEQIAIQRDIAHAESRNADEVQNANIMSQKRHRQSKKRSVEVKASPIIKRRSCRDVGR
ncbi:unnamed protein product [Calypogeia fissa]